MVVRYPTLLQNRSCNLTHVLPSGRARDPPRSRQSRVHSPPPDVEGRAIDGMADDPGSLAQFLSAAEPVPPGLEVNPTPIPAPPPSPQQRDTGAGVGGLKDHPRMTRIRSASAYLGADGAIDPKDAAARERDSDSDRDRDPAADHVHGPGVKATHVGAAPGAGDVLQNASKAQKSPVPPLSHRPGQRNISVSPRPPSPPHDTPPPPVFPAC